ncbi:MAG: hypothetical protein IMY72_11740 [Bacteroidetes bacterium]|nr:hypothetical protein [Bacteroidota bacterium]
MAIATRISVNDIFERYNSAFGYTAVKIAPRLLSMGFVPLKYFLNVNSYGESESSFAEMMFENNVTGDVYMFGLDQLENGTPALPFQTKKPINRRFLAPPPMISFSRGKHVVRTSIDRSNHDVIENFGNKPYEIKIQGILVDVEEHAYPGDLLNEIHTMFEAPGTYKAIGDIFNDLGITEVFFNSGFKLDFVEGYVDTIKFSVNAISVESAEFLIQ